MKTEEPGPSVSALNLNQKRVVAPLGERKEKKRRARKDPSELMTAAMDSEAQKILKQADLLHLALKGKLDDAQESRAESLLTANQNIRNHMVQIIRAVIAQSDENACKKVLHLEMIEKYPILKYFSLSWFSQKIRVGRENKKRYEKAQVKHSKVLNDQSSDSTFNLQNLDFFCESLPKNPFEQSEVDFKALARILLQRAVKSLPAEQGEFATSYLNFLEGGSKSDGLEKQALLDSAIQLLKSDWVQASKDKSASSFNKKLFDTLSVADKLDAHREVIEQLSTANQIGEMMVSMLEVLHKLPMESLNFKSLEGLSLQDMMKKLLDSKFFGDTVSVPRKLIQVLLATNEWRDVFLPLVSSLDPEEWEKSPVFKQTSRALSNKVWGFSASEVRTIVKDANSYLFPASLELLSRQTYGRSQLI